MTLKIEVTVPEAIVLKGGAASYLGDTMGAIGFYRAPGIMATHAFAGASARDWSEDDGGLSAETYVADSAPEADGEVLGARAASSVDREEEARAPEPVQPVAPVARERGKPSPGRQRRTKEEIAADEAADAADAAASATPKEAEPPLNISTGEERIDPQDEADEQAEADAHKADKAPKLTHDDVRKAIGKYVEAYGIAACQQDGAALLTTLSGPGKNKVTDIPDTQEALAAAVAAFEDMLAKNPHGREKQ